MTIRSTLKFIKIQIRKNKLLDKLYLYLRYGRSHPLSAKYWDNTWQNEGLETWRKYPETYDFIISLVSQGSRVLDVGCGVGILLNRLKAEKSCDVFGVDISPKAIEIARRSGIPGNVCQLPQIPLESDSFDIVIATSIFLQCLRVGSPHLKLFSFCLDNRMHFNGTKKSQK